MRWTSVGYAVTIFVHNCVFPVLKLLKSFGTEVPTRILGAQNVEIFGTELHTDLGVDRQTDNEHHMYTNKRTV